MMRYRSFGITGVSASVHFGEKPSPRKPMPSSPPTSPTSSEMLAQFLAGLVHGLERRARQFELAAWLEADCAAFRAIPAAERDDVAVLSDGFIPAETLMKRFEERGYAASPSYGTGP